MARIYKIVRKTLLVILILGVVSLIPLGLVLSHDSPCGPAPAIAPGAATMKAVVYRCYGPPEVLHVEAIEKPVPKDNEVLIKVHAAAVNPLDWHFMHGTPYVMRLSAGIGAPEDARLGVDYAGVVEAVGKDVKRFKPGDAVYGGRNGAFAQYVTVREQRNVVLKPANMTFEQAASVPVAAITALQALRDKGQIRAGQKVLINGASGGVGTFAVQIAKSYGAEVTGVCSTKNLELVRGLGADHVIDYTKEDFTKRAERYDLIVDMVGNLGLLDSRRALTPNGRMVIVGGGGPDGKWIEPFSGAIKALFVNPFIEQKISFMLAELTPEDLNLLSGLMQTGKMTPVIDRTYKMSEASEAIRYLEQGHARGKVIISMEGDEEAVVSR